MHLYILIGVHDKHLLKLILTTSRKLCHRVGTFSLTPKTCFWAFKDTIWLYCWYKKSILKVSVEAPTRWRSYLIQRDHWNPKNSLRFASIRRCLLSLDEERPYEKYIHLCKHTYIYIYIYLLSLEEERPYKKYVDLCKHTYIYIHVCICVCIYTYIYIYMYIHVYMYIYIYKYVY
jgi:hypothetical protein